MSETNDAGWRVDDSTFGVRLAMIRSRMGWNMKEAARECGLPAATWRTWEVDGAEPHNRIQVAEKISARTGCDFAWLLDPRLGRDRLVATATDGGRIMSQSARIGPKSHLAGTVATAATAGRTSTSSRTPGGNGRASAGRARPQWTSAGVTR